MARSHIYVRPMRTYDKVDEFAFVAAAETCGLSFPSNVFSLPSTRVMVAEKGGKVIAYQPTYASLVLGSVVTIGKASNDLASAMHQFTAAAFTKANTEGFADVLAFTSTPETEAYALRHSFERTHPAFRLEVR